jgi:hypothetical protein
MVSADAREDHRFVTLCLPRQLLWFNETPDEAPARGGATTIVPPYGIGSLETAPR